jgi:hypothetical protein
VNKKKEKQTSYLPLSINSFCKIHAAKLIVHAGLYDKLNIQSDWVLAKF